MIKEAIMNLTHEGAQTQKILKPVPFDKFDGSPHEISMKLGKFAVHIAESPMVFTNSYGIRF